VNVPRPYEQRPEVEVVVTTASFRRGQTAAWRDFEKDPDAAPNEALLAQLNDREFAAGYLDEWNNFCVPMRLVRERVKPL
jgi:hypothetical protein